MTDQTQPNSTGTPHSAQASPPSSTTTSRFEQEAFEKEAKRLEMLREAKVIRTELRELKMAAVNIGMALDILVEKLSQ